MKRLVLFIVLASTALAFAQEAVPPFPQISQDRILAEVGRCQVQLSAYEEYVVTLRNEIQKLQADNAALKMKLQAAEKAK